MQYTDTIRARMVRRMLGPGAVSANILAHESGIAQSTLSRWLRDTATFRAVSDKEQKRPRADEAAASRRPQDWTPADKLRAVVEASDLEGEALGEYLRRHGIHREHLEQWRADAVGALEKRGPRRGSSADAKRIKELERQLRRKEKALAETAALLVLRKKLNALWGGADDDTDEGNEP